MNRMVSNYNVLLRGEERKFEAGESSLFMVNSRESRLIETRLKAVELENDWLKAKGKLFEVLVLGTGNSG